MGSLEEAAASMRAAAELLQLAPAKQLEDQANATLTALSAAGSNITEAFTVPIGQLKEQAVTVQQSIQSVKDAIEQAAVMVVRVPDVGL